MAADLMPPTYSDAKKIVVTLISWSSASKQNIGQDNLKKKIYREGIPWNYPDMINLSKHTQPKTVKQEC